MGHFAYFRDAYLRGADFAFSLPCEEGSQQKPGKKDFALTFVYGLMEIYVLHLHIDPMYFMPNGDIQAGILRMDYGLYLFLYILLFALYVNGAYLIGDRANVKAFLKRKQRRDSHV